MIGTLQLGENPEMKSARIQELARQIATQPDKQPASIALEAIGKPALNELAKLIDRLDLSFRGSDIDAIALDGIRSLEREYSDGVDEALTLFAELLDYRKAPKKFQMGNYRFLGPITEESGGMILFGPIVIYSYIRNDLMLVDDRVGHRDAAGIEAVQETAVGKEKASRDGADVFHFRLFPVKQQMGVIVVIAFLALRLILEYLDLTILEAPQAAFDGVVRVEQGRQSAGLGFLLIEKAPVTLVFQAHGHGADADAVGFGIIVGDKFRVRLLVVAGKEAQRYQRQQQRGANPGDQLVVVMHGF